VQLKLNGVALGSALTSSNHIYLWPNVTLAPGVNTVVATGTRAGTTYTDTVTWTLH
jgi:beta-galactosidase